ncbi:MAG: molybdopterin-guanine dinucleotide biosynthesis protein B [Rhodospirillales bacterium]|nr:MAG: molybdopterin-guanine dinucleotide biosynthesis protein B [Rhodospirillales bacterium]
MRIIGIVGPSGSGKTSLLKLLIPELARRGLRVATVKHSHHGAQPDGPGDPGFEARAAGAVASLVAGPERWIKVCQESVGDEPSLNDVLARLTGADLVLIEGFKRYPHPKIEVHRPSHGRDPLWPTDASVVAVASDAPSLSGLDRPLLALGDIGAVADFLLTHCGFA